MSPRQLRRVAIFVSPLVLILLLTYLIFKWNPMSWLGFIGYALFGLKIFQWILIKEYHCSGCHAKVGRNDPRCHKCGAQLSNSGVVHAENRQGKEKVFLIGITVLVTIPLMVIFVIFPSLMSTFPRFTPYPVGTSGDTWSTAFFNSTGIGYIGTLIAKKVFVD